MAHTITLTDEQFGRLQAASQLYKRTPEQLVTDLLNSLPASASPLAPIEYDRRWDEFTRLVGSIQHGNPLNNEDIDELLGEEAAETHANDTASPDAPA